MKNLLIIALTLLLTACQATTGGLTGPISPVPSVQTPKPAHIKVYRNKTLLTSSLTISFTINGREVYSLADGEFFEFDLDAGQYYFGAKGVNSWRRDVESNEIYVFIESGRSYNYEINTSLKSPTIFRSNN